MPASENGARPVQPQGRLVVLDVLRGVALFGTGTQVTSVSGNIQISGDGTAAGIVGVAILREAVAGAREAA